MQLVPYFSTTSLNAYRLVLICTLAVQAWFIFSAINIPTELVIADSVGPSPILLSVHFSHQILARGLLIIAALYSLLIIGDHSKKDGLIDAFYSHKPTLLGLLCPLQLILFATLLLLSHRLSDLISDASQVPVWLDLFWGITLVLFAAVSTLIFAPISFYKWFFIKNATFLISSTFISLALLFIAIKAQSLWLEMAGITLILVVKTLGLFYTDVIYIPTEQIVGIGSFRVIINEQCSGYEGIALVSGMIISYLWLFRSLFRFPQALILLPIGMIAIWLINVIRITMLVVIGEEISPEIAIGGFHSNAGWLAFLAISLVILYIGSNSSRLRSKTGQLTTSKQAHITIADAFLWPFIILMLSTIMTGLVSAEFQWAYPLRVICVAVTLYLFWNQYRHGFGSFSEKSQTGNTTYSNFYRAMAAIAVGLAAFAIWIILVKDQPEKSGLYASELFNVASWITILWIIFRAIGSCITVPIAEELAFRGYFLQRLSGIEPGFSNKMALPLFSILCTSIAFGLLHNAWLAGSIVGVLYALVRVYGGHLYLAILAHATTNICLTLYVLTTQNWSLW